MSHGNTRYPGFGFCIYCGLSDVRLTDEHIVPFGLGGQHIIEKASCDTCSRITSRFELDVMRGLLWDFRYSRGAPSRKRSRPPKFVVIDPVGTPRQMPLGSYLAPGVIYRPNGLPGALLGLPPSLDMSDSWTLVALASDDEAKAFEAKWGFPMHARFRHVPLSFARMLAKIGYGQILTSYRPDEIATILLPFILRGTASGTSPTFVVGADMTPGPAQAGIGYRLETGLAAAPGGPMLIARVQLYAEIDTPKYVVAVGRTAKAAHS